VTKLAKKQGFGDLLSDCDVSNKASIAFHRNNGFKKVGYIKNYWDDEDSYVFSKKL
jgi:RimJ/RimL family protein N-acetyltransferase